MPHVRLSGSRALFSALLVALTAALLLTSTAASAQTSSSDASALRSEADALSTRYFTTLTRVQSLDDEITRSQQEVDDLAARAKAARAAARARALVAYTTSGTQLAALVDGESTLDSARRAHLIDRVNAKDEKTYNTLTRTKKALRKQQQQLRDAREAQASALDDLRAQGSAIDAKLATVDAQARAAAQAASTTTAPGASTTAGAATTVAPLAAAPTTTTAAPAPAPAPAPAAPAYAPTSGTNAHHDDPFLTCVRRRESGGNYGAMNPAGPYLGAYQFMQSTWNVTAAHAGRSDLVGVPANVASASDQDEMAWTLYQWQGPGPWGGGC